MSLCTQLPLFCSVSLLGSPNTPNHGKREEKIMEDTQLERRGSKASLGEHQGWAGGPRAGLSRGRGEWRMGEERPATQLSKLFIVCLVSSKD